jgi:hypothetical protein
MIYTNNVINTDYVITRIPRTSMERFVRMVLSSAPPLDNDLHTGDVFRIGVRITVKNVAQTMAFISFEPEFVQLVDSPREVELGAGSFEIETEWLLRAVQPTKGTKIRVECNADDMPQVSEFTVRILPSDKYPEAGKNR